MKLKELVNVTKNKRNNQISFNLKARSLKRIGINPESILNLNIPNKKNSLSFIKNKKGVKNGIIKKRINC